MSILDTNTPLKVKHVIICIVTVGLLWFGYSLYKQVKVNTANIQAVVTFLQSAQQKQ